MSLPIPQDIVQAEYIWIGGSGHDLRSKTKTLTKVPRVLNDLPEWNYDGSSTRQAPRHDSEVILKPRAFFKDPFRKGHHILVMCDTNSPTGMPLPDNTRAPASEIFESCVDKQPKFGFEQEYSLFKDGVHLGWPERGYPAPQGPYYCAIGSNHAFGRDLVDCHYRCCLYSGLEISGINAEVMPGQWEFQVGPLIGIEASDQLWIARYILQRIGESYGIVVDFDPKPVSGNWNGAGCHANFCIREFHQEGGLGLKAIYKALEKLEKKHQEMIKFFGEGNERRLTGDHETSSYENFSFGVGSRGVSIRIPNRTASLGRGYIEDRRPASNMDPYLVSSLLAQAICE